MAITNSPAQKQRTMDSIGSGYNTTGIIRVYTGTKPATADLLPSGTLLGTLTFAATAFGASTTGGVITANAIAGDTSADATGIAGWFRILLSADANTNNNTDRRIDGTITQAGGGGDMILDNTSVTLNGTISITSLTITHPA